MKKVSRIRRFRTPQDGLRAMAERAPQAEALAASWLEPVRPLAVRVYGLRRRIATVTVAVLAGLLFVHVMFGANGMVVYKQKRAEYESLQKRIAINCGAGSVVRITRQFTAQDRPSSFVG